MTTDNKRRVKTMMGVIKAACDRLNIDYEIFPDAYAVEFVLADSDVSFTVRLATETCVLGVIAEMPFAVPTESRDKTAIALCIINGGLADGSFDFDYHNGRILFRVTSSYRDSLIGERTVRQMLFVAADNVRKYGGSIMRLIVSGSLDEFRRALSGGEV